MQFKNPEVLYFLWLLIIPILVHLFQLQKFVKVPFSNVAFLQKIVQDSRKSSRIKKWLILVTRMLLFLAILLAFSQPFLSNKNAQKKQRTYIYLDNSISTNTKGKKGDLLKITAQEIIENAAKNDTYILETNTSFSRNISYTELKNKLLNINYTPKSVSLNSILLKISTLSKNESNTLFKNILLSDFQDTYKNKFTNVTPAFTAIPLEKSLQNNLSIDHVVINNKTDKTFTLEIVVKNQGVAQTAIPIAIFNKQKLISKQAFSIAENSVKKIQFTLQNTPIFLGKISITLSDVFAFDNTFYFTLNTTQKINVLSLGKATFFLPKIYLQDEFNLSTSSLKDLNYNQLLKQQIIVLNELENIPETLSRSLVDFSKKGGTIVIIPKINTDVSSYNLFLSKLTKAKMLPAISDSLKITNINYAHPILKNVFEKKVRNFQYPVVQNYHTLVAENNTNIVSFVNKNPFVSQLNSANGNLFWFASSLSKKNSNFSNSPLIVPIFYTIGKSSFQHSKLYYYLDTENTIDVETSVGKDEILRMQNKQTIFIPPQQTFQNKVTLQTKDTPIKVGFYYITRKKDTLKTIAFNNPKEESTLGTLDLVAMKSKFTNMEISNSVAEVFTELNKKNEVQWLWKWFLTLAIVSLLLEILILKLVKP